MNASRHRHASPLVVAFIAIGAVAVLTSHNDHVGRGFHREILATVNEATVLTAADMIPEQPVSQLPGRNSITASLR